MTSLEETREVIERYLRGHDTSVLADNAVFEVMASGQKSNGKAAIEQLMEYFYTKAFNAEFTTKSLTVGEGKAVLEADFHGKQKLEFAGIQPSSKEVHVPLCVSYDVSGGKITYARIYFETDAIRMQK
jgi:predicted ester cyclase